jgi:hypothetical protein
VNKNKNETEERKKIEKEGETKKKTMRERTQGARISHLKRGRKRRGGKS